MTGVHGHPSGNSGPSDDEVAAVVAALTRRAPAETAGQYERWRHTRLAALRDQGSDR